MCFFSSLFVVCLHSVLFFFFFFNDTATTEIYTLSLHDALPIFAQTRRDVGPEVPGGLDLLGQRRRLRDERTQLPLLLAARGATAQVQLGLLELRLREVTVHVFVEHCSDLFALHRSSTSLSSRRARCSCALDVPVATPVIFAISSCLYPSTSCSTNTARAPGGRVSSARSISTPASGPAFFVSGRSKAAGSSVLITRDVRRRRDRRSDSATFTANGCSHDDSALSPRKEPSLCQARTNTSCASSSAREASPAM